MLFFKPKIWIFLNINTILTCKSKNARMGAGVGAMVRLTTILHPYTVFFKLNYFSAFSLKLILKFLKFKCSLTTRYLSHYASTI